MEIGPTHKFSFVNDKTKILVRSILFLGALSAANVHLDSQLVAEDTARSEREVWTPDATPGRYRNPIVYADYSDPDAIRLGSDFYLVASSFDAVPGLPVLHSRDLIHWELIGHALSELLPADRYREVQPGRGVWAPSLRYHAGEFYIYYPDPDYGIYMVKAKAITGPWSEPLLVKAAKGWIDPCPLWDDDGNAYMVNALAGSRAGAKSVVILSRMSNDGTTLLDGGSIIIDGHWDDTTLEGPKLYKHGGYYYVFAPAGGVRQGYEVVFRSRSITGPYDRRVVLHQGSSTINGPHQGAWVTTATGEDWFLHFQDRGAYGRVLDLEPMSWTPDGWPAIGRNQDSRGTGEPVVTFLKPLVRTAAQSYVPAMSDEFNTSRLGLQWQWQANPGSTWAFPDPAVGALRMICVPIPPDQPDLRYVPQVLLQKFPAPEFVATTNVRFTPLKDGERTGLVVLGQGYSTVYIELAAARVRVVQETRSAGHDGVTTTEAVPLDIRPGGTVSLRASVGENAQVQFSFSANGERFQPIGSAFQATAGIWIGAKVGIYALRAGNAEGNSSTGEFGFADFDWFHISR